MAKTEGDKTVITVPVKTTSIFSTKNILIVTGITIAIVGIVTMIGKKYIKKVF